MKNSLNKIVPCGLLLLSLVGFNSGCALLGLGTPAVKVAEVRDLSFAAASVGTSVALRQNPGWRPQFEAACKNLDKLVTDKTLTGELLRQVIASLPVKELKSETARIAI